MATSSLTKPQMRGLLAKRLRFHIVGAFIVSLGVATFYKVCIFDFFTLCSWSKDVLLNLKMYFIFIKNLELFKRSFLFNVLSSSYSFTIHLSVTPHMPRMAFPPSLNEAVLVC